MEPTKATVKDLQTKLSAAQQKLTDWRATYSVSATLEGWIPGSFENLGSWHSVPDMPKQTKDEPFPAREATFPLFALFPDPKILKHSAQGRNIYFGVVPTSSLDTDRFGVHVLTATPLMNIVALSGATRSIARRPTEARLPWRDCLERSDRNLQARFGHGSDRHQQSPHHD